MTKNITSILLRICRQPYWIESSLHFCPETVVNKPSLFLGRIVTIYPMDRKSTRKIRLIFYQGSRWIWRIMKQILSFAFIALTLFVHNYECTDPQEQVRHYGLCLIDFCSGYFFKFNYYIHEQFNYWLLGKKYFCRPRSSAYVNDWVTILIVIPRFLRFFCSWKIKVIAHCLSTDLAMDLAITLMI